MLTKEEAKKLKDLILKYARHEVMISHAKALNNADFAQKEITAASTTLEQLMNYIDKELS